MKKNDYVALASALVYTYLFYHQLPGINYLIFSVVLVAIIFISKLELLTKPAALATALGAIVSGVFVFYYSTDLAIVANISSLLALGAFSLNPQSSFIVSMLHSLYSVVMFIPLTFLRKIDENMHEEEHPGERPAPQTNWQRGIIIVIALLIVLVFFALYKDASPVFSKLADSIKFDFISGEFLLFFTVTFLVLVGFFRQQVIDWIFNNDNNSSDKLKNITEGEHLQSYLGKLLGIKNEVFAGVLLLALLNLLLAAVNGIDIFYSTGMEKLPDGMTLADYLHDGTNSLIISIIFAVIIILFFFRGYLNYAPKSKALKLLTYAWIAQNIVLVLTTCNRNLIYIDTYGLTYKRVGVFVFLLLCVIGLVTTFIKVLAGKSNWFLFRKNGWIFYAVLLVYACFNWDVIIAKHNIAQAKNNKGVELDYYYLYNLQNALPELLAHYEEHHAKNDSADIYNRNGNMAQNLNQDVAKLYKHTHLFGWQSLCLEKKQNWDEIKSMYDKGHYQFLYPQSLGIEVKDTTAQQKEIIPQDTVTTD